LQVAGEVASFAEGIDLAKEVIDSGAATNALNRLVASSHKLAAE
jgi:anthranilate phosphoribosyltransferase